MAPPSSSIRVNRLKGSDNSKTGKSVTRNR